MIKLMKHLRWYHGLLIVILFGLVYVQVNADLQLPSRLASILEQALNRQEDYASYIWNIGLEMLGFVLLSIVATILVALIASIVAAEYANDIRKAVYEKVQRFSFEEIEKFSTASLITRSTNDVSQVQTVTIMILRMAISAPLMAVSSIGQVRATSGQLSLIVLFAVIFVVTFMTVIVLLVLPKFKKIQNLTDELNLVTRENLTGIRVIRAHDAKEIKIKQFSKVNEEFRKQSTFANRTVSLVMPGLIFTMNMTSLFVVWIGVIMVSNNELEIFEVTMFQQYATMVVMAFVQLTFLLIQIPRASVSAKRINEVLDTQIKVNDPVNKKISTNELLGKIEFKNVNFSYPDAKASVLEDISFTANQGEMVAFIGSTGSGKSTLINLIPRFFDVTSGEILVDDINVKEYIQEDLREKIGYVPQKGMLFSGSILDNLKYGKNNPSEEEIKEALDISCALEFVSKLDEGIDYQISQGGKNVSGGQRQRLSIARAVIKNPNIFIFDDSFSALDYKTDLLVREKLNEKTKNVTKLVVAQRIGTIISADKIIVLDKGKIANIGTHKELLQKCDIYKEIALSQLSKEELLNE